MASDASTSPAKRQDVEQFLNDAPTKNLPLSWAFNVQLHDGKWVAQMVPADSKDDKKRVPLHIVSRKEKTDVCGGLIFNPNTKVKRERQDVEQFLNDAPTKNLRLSWDFNVQLHDGKWVAQMVPADSKDDKKRVPLHIVSRKEKTDVCGGLIFNPNTKVKRARQGHTETSKYLIDCCANGNVPSELGATALRHDVGIGHMLRRFLLSKGVESVDIDSQSDAGTPLAWAAGQGQRDAAKILLEHLADANAETEDNITPLLSSLPAGSVACLGLLIQAGAKVNLTAVRETISHIAAAKINSLLKSGTDPSATDEDELKAVQVVDARCNRNAVEILSPLNMEITIVSESTVGGILEHMQSETGKEQAETKEDKLQRDAIATTSKQEMPEVLLLDDQHQQEGEETKLKKRSAQDDFFNRRETSAFKKQKCEQHATEGKRKLHAKKKGKHQPWWKSLPTIPMASLRDFTKEELKHYNKMVLLSEGFDVGFVPAEIFMDIIVPLDFETYDRGTLKIYENMAKKSIKHYNDLEETAYKFVKLIRVNRKAVAGRLFFLTFEAVEDTTNDAAPQNFQARLFTSIDKTTVVQFCRVEQYKQPGSEEKCDATHTDRCPREETCGHHPEVTCGLQ